MVEHCPECGAASAAFVINEEGHDVCSDCGLIQSGRQTFASPRPSVAPAPAPVRKSRTLPVLHRNAIRQRHVTSKDRWLRLLRDMSNNAGLHGAIGETAAEVYRRGCAMPDWKNRKHDYQVGLLVACLFHACNLHKAHRTPTELCVQLGVDPRNARKMVKVMERAAMDVSSRPDHTTSTDVPNEVLPRCAHRIHSLPADKLGAVRKIAKAIYQGIRQEIDNHRPDTITAGLLSVSLARCDVPVTDADIARACLVAPNTVRTIANRITLLASRRRL
jgi:transcription initiation factor TFIIIB Brf1 subunit/transcription initiation factor TFIIB